MILLRTLARSYRSGRSVKAVSSNGTGLSLRGFDSGEGGESAQAEACAPKLASHRDANVDLFLQADGT